MPQPTTTNATSRRGRPVDTAATSRAVATRLAGVAGAVVGLLLGPAAGAASASPEAGDPWPDPDDTFDTPGVDDLVAKGIEAFFRKLVEDALNPLLDLLGQTLLTTPTPDELPRIGELWEQSRQFSVASSVLLVMVAGIIVMGYETVQTRHSVKEILPRLVLAFLGANLSLLLAGKAILFANAASAAVMGDGLDPDEAAGALSDLVLGAVANRGVFLILLGLAVALMLIVLLVVYVVRVALTLILIASAPLAIMCYALPQTEAIARWWWRAFAGVLAIQLGQSLTLIVFLRVFLDDDGFTLLGGPTGDGMVNLLVCLALFYVLVKIPFWIGAQVRTGSGRSLVGSLVRGFVAYKTFGLLRGGRTGTTVAAAVGGSGGGGSGRGRGRSGGPPPAPPSRPGSGAGPRRPSAGPSPARRPGGTSPSGRSAHARTDPAGTTERDGRDLTSRAVPVPDRGGRTDPDAPAVSSRPDSPRPDSPRVANQPRPPLAAEPARGDRGAIRTHPRQATRGASPGQTLPPPRPGATRAPQARRALGSSASTRALPARSTTAGSTTTPGSTSSPLSTPLALRAASEGTAPPARPEPGPTQRPDRHHEDRATRSGLGPFGGHTEPGAVAPRARSHPLPATGPAGQHPHPHPHPQPRPSAQGLLRPRVSALQVGAVPPSPRRPGAQLSGVPTSPPLTSNAGMAVVRPVAPEPPARRPTHTSAPSPSPPCGRRGSDRDDHRAQQAGRYAHTPPPPPPPPAATVHRPAPPHEQGSTNR